jgi:hypothetical protein
MKKIGLPIILLMAISFLIFFVSAIEITEVELNPNGSDSGNEWIEIFSDNSESVKNLEIMNNDNESIFLNISFEGFYKIIFTSQFLDNPDEKISILLNSTIIDETEIFEDSENDDLTWQLCDGGWIFTNSTPSSENDCPSEPEESEDEQEEPEENETEDTGDSEEENEDGEESVTSVSDNGVESNNISSGDSAPTKITSEIIYLNSQKEEGESSNVFFSKDENLRLGIIYAFTTFCVLVIIFLAFRKL